jgi:Protein of unknown function, DUF547
MRGPTRAALLAAIATLAVLRPVASTAQAPAPQIPAREAAYDHLLDTYVRDGLVYYRTIKGLRSTLDRYVASLATVAVDGMPRDGQVAFWINAYNAIVIQTVIDHYPIPRLSKAYPPGSIRQIPGAFERTTHRAGGRTVTLDQIEQQILPAFRDPRVFFALGRGSIGGGRLRSEAYTAQRLESQLAAVALECDDRSQCVAIDPDAGTLSASSIFSWRSQDFVAAYGDKAPAVFAARSPIERAILSYIQPKLLPFERTFLERNDFKLRYIPFDWRLNDLTGR